MAVAFLLVLVVLVALSIHGGWAWKPTKRAVRNGMASVLAITLTLSDSALAKGPEGSKTSKKFEGCMSTCVFDATKPAPIGSGVERLVAVDQRTAIRECKKKCAKSKAQLMTGEPKRDTSLTDKAVDPAPEE